MSGDISRADLAKQIDTYSNAIVGFAVLQSLAYSYSFGTNEMFNCLVKTAKHLAAGLSLMFALVTVLLIVAMIFFTRAMRQLSGDFTAIVEKIYLGKGIAVVIFSMLPIALTVGYGVFEYPHKYDCKRPLHEQSDIPPKQ